MGKPPASSFLGSGWGFPPEFSPRSGSCRMVSGVEDIKESIWILLSTIPGERVMVPTYGCNLDRFLFHDVTTGLISEIRDMVSIAIMRWEPRIDLTGCLVTIDAEEPALLRIELAFRVRRTNVRSNMVFPFYIAEATLRREA
jgi:phage baseplate assembly protein W